MLELLAYLSALSLNAVQTKQDRPGCHRLTHADQLAEKLDVDMARWWTPSVEGFYGRLSKAMLVDVIREAGTTTNVVISSLKKIDAARDVAKLLSGSGWLPQPLARRSESETPAEYDEAA